ncbi:MAG: zinc-dependent metalloprotease [Candidatus Bathyarchaeota archaeon]|nr:zinc-dependent metalloprotease [Candidatus Bathyarchaeota archaeon]
MANQKLTVMKGLLLAVVLMLVVASRVTRVSGVPQEVVECDLSDFAAFANETMSMEERLCLEPLRIPGPPPPPPTPPAENIYVLIVVDDTMKWVREFMLGRSCPWTEIEEWAHTIFERGVEQFENDFGIGNFYHVETEFWVPGTMGLQDELHKAQTTFNWPDAYPAHYDCMVIMSGNIDGNKVGYAQKFGYAFIMSVKAAFLGMPVWHVFQHEASHLYGAEDHKGLDGWTTWCIMSYTWLPLTRSWCGRCTDIISANKHHFG